LGLKKNNDNKLEIDMNKRVEQITSAIVSSLRNVLREQDVTFEEYRTAVMYMGKVAEAKELPLLIDVFLNITMCEISDAHFKGSRSDLEGPYFRSDSPFVTDEIKTMNEYNGRPTLMKGKVTDLDGKPLANTLINIWQSTPDGKYSGFHDDIPVDFYRGKVKTDDYGYYAVRCTAPVPYEIKNDGPTGALLEMIGRHTWRPAHIHYKAEKEGFRTVTTQAYFEGGDWVGDDCCDGRSDDGERVIPEKYEDGKLLIEVDFVLDAN